MFATATMFDYRRWLAEQVAEAAAEWKVRQFSNPCEMLYLYYRPSTPEQSGSLRVSTETPAGYVLADPRRLSPACTVDQVRHRIAEIAHRLPVLPYC